MTRIYVPDIECDSCVKLISRKIQRLQGIESYKIKHDYLDVKSDDSLIKDSNIVNAIQESGFRASLEPFERKTLKERIRHIKENPSKYVIEQQEIKYAIYAFLSLAILQAVAYYGIFRFQENFLQTYGWWLLYLDISVAVLGAAIWHIYAYEAKVTCMVGMMIGMTVGMQAGMMIGAVVGATNGFFTGAMTGMLLGVFVGAVTGKCCGVMGIMEGMMAGLMGGTMGPMISVMMYADHLMWFMPVYIIINILIIAGLSYMMLEEVVENRKNVRQTPADLTTFLSACVVVGFIITLVIIYGPKAPLFAL